MAVKEEEKVVEPIDALESNAQDYEVVLSENTTEELRLIQKPLTFFGKMEFFSVMGKAVDRALSEGLSVGDLFDVPDRRPGEPLDASAFKEADLFVKAVVKLVSDAPDIFLDMYCVILAVPRAQREYIKERLDEEMTDEQGIEVLNNFVDQNWDVMVNFFKEKINPLVSKVSQKFQPSESSKPSRATRRATQKK
jgi:hypothetical protein